MKWLEKENENKNEQYSRMNNISISGLEDPEEKESTETTTANVKFIQEISLVIFTQSTYSLRTYSIIRHVIC